MPILLHQLLVHVLQHLAPLERYGRAPQQHEAVERRRAGEENPLADVGAAAVPLAPPPTEGQGGAGGEAEGAREEEVGREPGGEAAEEVVEGGEMEIVELGPEGREVEAEVVVAAAAGGRLELATLVDAEFADSEGAAGAEEGGGGQRRRGGRGAEVVHRGMGKFKSRLRAR